MSIDQTEVIDSIGVDDSTGKVVLTISDELEWDKNHLMLLQDKLNTYLGFIESGELLSSYPDSKNREVLINVNVNILPTRNQRNIYCK